MSESIYHVTIVEEFPIPTGKELPPEPIERLSMRLDGPLDIPHIVSVLGAKKRAPRSDRGQARKKNTQPELPNQ